MGVVGRSGARRVARPPRARRCHGRAHAAGARRWLHDVASQLLTADDPVLRFRALVMAARFGLRRLRPHVEALVDDPGTFGSSTSRSASPRSPTPRRSSCVRERRTRIFPTGLRSRSAPSPCRNTARRGATFVRRCSNKCCTSSAARPRPSRTQCSPSSWRRRCSRSPSCWCDVRPRDRGPSCGFRGHRARSVQRRDGPLPRLVVQSFRGHLLGGLPSRTSSIHGGSKTHHPHATGALRRGDLGARGER